MRQTHPSNGATTITVYDAFGRMAAEYSNQAPTGPAGLVYRMADHLGSTRLAMQGSSVLARYDYLPFGERIGSGINSRSSLYGSTGSMVITGQDHCPDFAITIIGRVNRRQDESEGRSNEEPKHRELV